ncbi:hypothetical protein BP6252_00911 [Coleophoma cylindrospora]|uniref:Peptidase S54 rhomboid domain-containing protein n=1 Tax=Coleophoma cylindrospora TaxID=1849047 RepID=A0A3D8SRE0_9HELO|nr:hypothetical protein BP6252_00911 [Coleophoma cylindrospora]
MNTLCPLARRTICQPPLAILQTCLRVDSLAARLARGSNRTYFILARSSPRRVESSIRIWSTSNPSLGLQVRNFASRRIITEWEELPKDYEDEQGLEFRNTLLSRQEIQRFIGKDIEPDMGNQLLKVMHGRRVAGTLSDPSYTHFSGFSELAHQRALAWLRQNVPVDEDHNEGMRAQEELRAMNEELISDAERIGLYQPNSAPRAEGESVHGVGVFEKIRKAKEEAFEAQEEARKKQMAEVQQVTGTLQTVGHSNVELRRPGENPKLKYYLERAKVLPDAPPEMSKFQRLWPSALVTLAVIGGSVMFAQLYTPPPNSARMFPDEPPAAVTVNAIMAANVLIFALWRFPPAFRMLEKYFISVPGYPRALSMLGNVFSHKDFSHLFLNMLGVWFAGTRLHDDVGRANFLAIYLSAGVIGSFTSLSYFVARSYFMSSSLGASGALMGIGSAYLWLHSDSYMKFFGFPPDPAQGISGSAILAALLCYEVGSILLSRRSGMGFKHDHASHLGGAFAGIVAAQILKNNAAEKKRKELERRKNLGFLDKIKEGRL